MCRNEKKFCQNPWEHAHKKLQPLNNTNLSYDALATTIYFTDTQHYSDSTVTYGDHLPLWISETIPNCDTFLFNTDNITSSLVKSARSIAQGNQHLAWVLIFLISRHRDSINIIMNSYFYCLPRLWN